MSDNDSSDLSSLDSDIEDPSLEKKNGILKFFPKVSKKSAPPAQPKTVARTPSPPPPLREPSPPHEYVLADNPDIAFAVMFRARFKEAFPKSLPNFGPQELERAIVPATPGDAAVQFLCALLGLLLNRKQDVKSGHYNRALEEAISTHKQQWAKDWEQKNPISGSASFETMDPAQRLTLLRTLILWTLSSSQTIRDIIAASYKQNRQEDDLNQPLSVQPWGQDAYKKKYYLIEGIDDTNFRIYKESGGFKEKTWWSVAGCIEDLNELADKLSVEDGGQRARTLATKMRNAVPRFEATEEKRKRREYRQTRKDQFKRPDPGFSMYEGRTRGKRMKYTYSDEEDEVYSDATSRRSTRNTGANTPADSGPTVTQSGRQVRSRAGGVYGESILSSMQGSDAASRDATEGEESSVNGGRPRRAAAVADGRSRAAKTSVTYDSGDNMEEESDESEQDYGGDDEDEHVPVETDEEDLDDLVEADDDLMDIDGEEKKSLVVKLPVKTPTPERKSYIKLNMSPTGSLSSVKAKLESASIGEEVQAVSATTNEPAVSSSDQAIPGSVVLPVQNLSTAANVEAKTTELPGQETEASDDAQPTKMTGSEKLPPIDGASPAVVSS